MHETPPSRTVRAWLVGACRSGTDTQAALAMFDRLDPLPVEAALGRWCGVELPTGHPLDGMLEAFDWAGKDMRDPRAAFPLLFEHDGEVIAIEPKYLPVRFATRWQVHRSRWFRSAFDVIKPLLRTTKPSARLCMTECRGRSSATLLYDTLPIRDVFRRMDDGCLLGLMECRYFEAPYFFVLERA